MVFNTTFSYIMTVSFICAEIRSTLRKPLINVLLTIVHFYNYLICIQFSAVKSTTSACILENIHLVVSR
jgi:cytochrome c oxidase assembly factor CtaG